MQYEEIKRRSQCYNCQNLSLQQKRTFKNLKRHPKNKNVPFIYTNKRFKIADLFKYSHIAAFKLPRNKKDTVMRPRLDIQLINDGFRTCSDAIGTYRDRFATLPSITECNQKYWVTSCRRTNAFYMVCSKLYAWETGDLRRMINDHHFIILTPPSKKKINEKEQKKTPNKQMI